MSIDMLHKICAMRKLASVTKDIPGRELIITVDVMNEFGERKTGEELANEIRRKAEMIIMEAWKCET